MAEATSEVYNTGSFRSDESRKPSAPVHSIEHEDEELEFEEQPHGRRVGLAQATPEVYQTEMPRPDGSTTASAPFQITVEEFEDVEVESSN